MPRKPKPLTREGEPSQRTEKGLEIPVPERSEFFKGLKRAAKAEKDVTPDDPSRSDPASR
jgi:hypothetical protein